MTPRTMGRRFIFPNLSQPLWIACGIATDTPLSRFGAGRALLIELAESYARLAAVAAAAFLAAFAAVEALRRRLVFGGVAGASPINSAVMMLVTNSLGPCSSKSTAVRSWSEAGKIPTPYSPCLIV